MSSLQKNLELGRERLGCGDYLVALTYADAALALDATSFEALQLRGRALYLLGRDTEALQTLRQAHTVLQKLLPDGPSRNPLDALDVAEDDTLTDNPSFGSDALETLLALRERHALDEELLALLAELAEDAGRYEIAREAFHELVSRQPDNLTAWEGLVHVLCHEDLDAALETIDRALQRFPTHPLFYEFLGFIRFRRRQYRFAIIAYRQAIEHGAQHTDSLQALIECYLALGEETSALELAHLLAQHGVNDVEIHRFVLEVYLRCEQYEAALAHAHQLVRLQPSHAETYCYKAWVELAHGDWSAAERSLRLGFHKAVDGAFALFELVEILLADAEFPQALQVVELAAELAPDHPESSAARGKVLREMGDFTEALEAFRQAATLAPQDDAYQTWMGVVLDNLGEHREALCYFNHVLSRHPTDVWTLSNRGLTYLALEMAEQALTDFSRGIEIDPEDAPLYFWRACASVKLDRATAAFRDLHRAIDLSEEIYPWLEEEPLLAPLHQDARFHELVHRADDEG